MSLKPNSSRHREHSLRNLSWDSKDDKTRSQKLISSTVHEWYDAKHRATSSEETEFINSLSPGRCPLCGSSRIVSGSHYKSGIKRFLCRDCDISFHSLTKKFMRSHGGYNRDNLQT